MIVAKKMEFDSAHFLPDYKGKCSQMHGHHWVVEVACKGEVGQRSGMVVDFKDLKIFLDVMEEKFDHKLINDFIKNPTAENICQYIYDEFYMWCIARGLRFSWIKVWETADSMAMMEA